MWLICRSYLSDLSCKFQSTSGPSSTRVTSIFIILLFFFRNVNYSKKFHSMQMKECDDSTNVSWNNSETETDLEEFNRKISSIWLQLYGINRDLDRLWNVHSITFLVIQSEMSFFQLFLLYHVSVYFSLGSQSQSTGMTFYVLTLWKRLSLIF